jgi:hypothetical protein
VHHKVLGRPYETDSEIRENTYAALLAAGVTVGNDSSLPSIKDWGTTTTGNAEVTFATMLSDLLPTILEDVVSWVLPTEDAAAGLEAGDVNAYRVYCRSKSWRSKCVAMDPLKKTNRAIVAFLSVPLDNLSSQLQYLDNQGDSLTDCVVPKVSPIKHCSTQLMDLLASGALRIVSIPLGLARY